MRREDHEKLTKETDGLGRLATDQVRYRVACAFGDKGHWVTIIRDQNGVLLTFAAECRDENADAGEAVARLGGHHCGQVVTRLRERLLSNDYGMDRNYNKLPLPLRAAVETMRELRMELSRARKKTKQAVKDPCGGFKNRADMYSFLASKQGSLVAGFEIKVIASQGETSNDLEEYDAGTWIPGSVYLINHDGRAEKHLPVVSRKDGRWVIREEVVRKMLAPEKRERVRYLLKPGGYCEACRDSSGRVRQFRDQTSHARTKQHADNVIAGLYRVVKLLSPKKGKSLVDR